MNTSIDLNLDPVRVLIVDDHPNTAEMLARVIRKLDLPVEVITALSGEDALEQVGQDSVDVLITDFMMPGMNGLKLIEQLQECRKPDYTILITAYDTPGLSATTRRLDIQNYLVKPVDPQRIRSIVSKALEEIISDRMVSKAPDGRHPFKILIADDHPDNIRLLSVRLRSEGYDFVTANDGLEVLEKLRDYHPDLALLDVNMPTMDGFEVLKEMRRDPKLMHIPVIMVSAVRIAVKDVQEGLTLGADDYIVKPVEWRELSARIRAKLRVKQAEDALRHRARELGVLPEISHDLSERLDIEGLTQTVLKRTVAALNADNGYLTVFHRDGSYSLQIYDMFDFSPWTWGDVQKRISSEGLVAKVVDTRQGLVIEDTVANDWWLEIPNDRSRSAIAMPLLGRSDVLGVIVLTHQDRAHFEEGHLDILQAIASQAAIALENASLYASENKRVSELVALNHLTRQINLFSHSTELNEQLPSLIRQSLHYPVVVLWSMDGYDLELCSIIGEEAALNEKLMKVGPEQAVLTGQPAQLSGHLDEKNGTNGKNNNGSQPQQESVIAVPIIHNQAVTGVLSIHSRKSSAFHESDRVLLETIAMQYEAAMQRIQLFESVEQEKMRMDAVLQAAADAILLVGVGGTIQLVNLAGERLFTDVDTRIGSPLPSGQGYDELIDFLEAAHLETTLTQGEIIWPDQRTFSVHATPIQYGGLVVVLHDITQFKDLERIKNEFIATASHDLKNPISAVIGYSSLLEKAGPLNDQQKEFVTGLHRASTQMYELVLNLLEMARYDLESSLQLESLNVTELLEEFVADFQIQADSKGHSMYFEAPDEDLRVSVDKSRIRQVMQNLMGNAIKYTPENGRIDIRTQPKNGQVWIKISDSGLGIPEKDLPHIFDKFYRVETDDRSDIQGNGLGLAIVRAIVDQHGGEVQVASVLGEGSTFSFSLPMGKNE
jgi:signal transduction histidine kinase/DNA-binding response OmpR family regulator